MDPQAFTLLLVSRNIEDAWLKRFLSYLVDLGTPDFAQKPQVLNQLRRTRYNFVILDETTLIGDYSFIQKILYIQPDTRVIVVTDITDWRRARQAFLYGAVDYLTTLVKQNDFISVLQEI